MSSAAESFKTINKRLFNKELERDIIGMLFTKKESQLEILTSLKPEYFSSEENKALFEVILGMFYTQHDITYVGVYNFLELKLTIGNKQQVKDALEQACTESLKDSVFNSISILKELYKNRRIYYDVLMKGDIMFQNNEKTEDIISHMATILVGIDSGKKEISIDKVVDNVIDNILGVTKMEHGLHLGLDDLDIQFDGIKKDSYYLIGAESGAGKTAFLVDIIFRLCERHADKIAILFFSLEMSEKRVVKRAISRITRFSIQKMENRMKAMSENDQQIAKQAANQIRSYPLEIVYETMTNKQMSMRMRKFALEHPGKQLIVMVDHIGLVTGDTNDMRVNTINASTTMKSFCRDFDASVFVLTQFTKEIDSMENRKNFHRPHMGYIMESGRLRQDADVVWLLWRPETRFAEIPYGNQVAEDGSPVMWQTKDKLIILNEKNRDGQAPTDIIVKHNIACNVILNLSDPF